MKKVILMVEDYLYEFYSKIGDNADGLTVEQVMSDALFKFAAEASISALSESNELSISN